jgi:hypothetical protein
MFIRKKLKYTRSVEIFFPVVPDGISRDNRPFYPGLASGATIDRP